MKTSRIEAFLTAIGSRPPTEQTRSSWVVSGCPLARWRHKNGTDRHPSFGVSLRRPHRVNCFSCGYTGSMTELLLELQRLAPPGELNLKQAWELSDDTDEFDIEMEDWMPALARKEEEETWPEWFLDSFKPAIQFEDARAYLRLRDVPQEVAHKLDLRFDSQRRRICFPIRNWKGELCGLHGRAIDPTGPDKKYFQYGYKGQRNPQVWLGEHWVDQNKPLLVVESVFDLAAVLKVYDNAVAAMYAHLQKAKVKRLVDCYEQVWFFDNDKAGQDGMHKATKDLPDNVIWYVQYPPGCTAKDPGELNEEELNYCLRGLINIDKRAVMS